MNWPEGGGKVMRVEHIGGATLYLADCIVSRYKGVSMVSVSTRTDSSHRFLFVTLNVEFTKIDLGCLDGEEAEKLADEFQAISNEIRDFAKWINERGHG